MAEGDFLTRTFASVGGVELSLFKILFFVLGLTAVVLAARLLYRLLLRLLDQVSLVEPAERLSIARIGAGLALVFGLIACLEALGVGVAQPFLTLGATEVSLFSIALFVALTSGVLTGSQIAGRAVTGRLLAHFDLDEGLRYAIGRITYYILLVVGMMAALQTVGVQMGSLAVLLGALGVGIGFGLQNIVNNFVSGLILLFERPIKVGDWIELQGVSGRVTDIGARSTKVVTNDNVTIIIPNGDCLSQRLTNWSYNSSLARLRLPVSVALGSSLETVRNSLLEIARKHPKVSSSPEPRVLLDQFGDSQLCLELAIWFRVGTIGIIQLRSDLNFEIERVFRERGIQFPKPRLEWLLSPEDRQLLEHLRT